MSPMSAAMRGLDRVPLRSAKVHQSVPYEDVCEIEDGLRGLVDDVSGNANNNVRVRNVNDLNDSHAINWLGTNGNLLNVGDDFARKNELRVSESMNSVPVSVANVYVSAASAPSMRAKYNSQEARGVPNAY